MKKVLSIVLTVLLVVSIIPTGLFGITASATISDYYDYSISDGAVTINGVDESVSGDITIPSTLGGYPVTIIGDYAFAFCDNLVSVTIPDSVIRIGDSAFDFCDNLTDVRIGNGVRSIGQDAFAWCGNLTNVTIGNSVTSIGEDAFCYCENLKKVQINDIAAWCKIDFLGGAYTNPLSYAHKLYLKDQLVTSLVIPDSVTSISDYAFFDCTSLTSITIGTLLLSQLLNHQFRS